MRDRGGVPVLAERDVDGDGRLDLVFSVRSDGLQLSPGDKEAAASFATPDGRTFADADWVTVVPW